MTYKAHLLGCTALVAVVGVPAQAEGPASAWDGMSVVAGVGGSIFDMAGDAEASSTFDSKTSSAATSFDFFDKGGATAVVGLGYDRAVSDNLVVGVRGLARFGAATEVSGTFDNSAISAKDEGGSLEYFANLKNSATVSGRVGYALSGGTLLYVMAGVTGVQLESGGSFDPDNGGPLVEWSDSEFAMGTTLGLGAEAPLPNGYFGGIEISATNFDDLGSDYSGVNEDGLVSLSAKQAQVSIYVGRHF